MICTDNIFAIADERDFEREALDLFRFQAERCAPYAEWLRLTGCDPQSVLRVEDIPMLPIELFKSHDVYCGGQPPEKVFTSSNTGGCVASRHMMSSLAHYRRAFTESFRRFYGEPREWSIYGLLPNYLEREGSSLVYMVDRLMAAAGSGGFFLHDYPALIRALENDPKPKILLGVSYALWELAEQYAPRLHDTVVMETGGMKGRREELPKSEFHKILCDAFGVDAIHSEYGMAELTSQAYSSGEGVFASPPWVRVLLRDINDPTERLAAGVRGGVDIIDLSNVWSCAFIATQDTGRLLADGRFTIEGRIAGSDIRGCNLLIQ
ncbi:MAG: acyltransferase [Alistipes sp.]|nr:acyltransferase [Alistipes sp.]MDE7130135.1 acyltransferase [Alistipes sp.]